MADGEIPGIDESDDALGALVREHLSARLDGQLGRSAAHFRRHLDGGRSGAAPGAGSLRRSWVVGVVGGAMAASIAALWAGPALWPPPARPDAPGVRAQAAPAGDGFDYDLDEVTLSTQTRDGGVVVLDDHTAARRVLRREVRHTRWVDEARGASVEKVEPRQDVMLIKMDTY